MKKWIVSLLLLYLFLPFGKVGFANSFENINGYPPFPEVSQKHYVVYREGYRENRIEVAFFDIADDSSQCLLWNQGLVLEDNSKYVNDAKYYLDGDTWINFENGYTCVSNHATEVIASDLDVKNTYDGGWLYDITKLGKADLVSPFNGNYMIKCMGEPVRWSYPGHIRAYPKALFIDTYGNELDYEHKYYYVDWGDRVSAEKKFSDPYFDIYKYVSVEDFSTDNGKFQIFYRGSQYRYLNEPYLPCSCYSYHSGNWTYDMDSDIVSFCDQDGYFIYQNDGKYGVVSALDYHEIIPCIYDEIHYCNSHLFALTDANGTKLVSAKTGEIIIPVEKKYKYFGYFKDGICPVYLGEEYSVCIDITGNVILEGDYRYYIGENGVITAQKTKGVVMPPNDPEWDIIRITNAPVFINLNGNFIESYGRIENDRTLVPVRSIFENFGMTVSWLENMQKVIAVNQNNVIEMTVGEDHFYLNGNAISLDVPAQIYNARTLVPVRAIAEALNLSVEWDEGTRTVLIQNAI